MADQDFTIFVGNLHEKVTEEILYELFLQAGPIAEVRIPSNKGVPKNYGFVQFKHEISVPYALHLLNGTLLYDRAIKLNSRSRSLHLFCPPQLPRRVERERFEPNDDCSSLRSIGGSGKMRFTDKSMLPSAPSRKVQKIMDDTPIRDDTLSLRGLGGSVGRRFDDRSMQPSSRKSSFPPDRKDDRSPSHSWSPKHYPSQSEDIGGHERRMNDYPREKHRHDRGISNHLNKPHHKTPYHIEKHHNKDRKKFDSYPSQRSRPRHFTH